jgi:hypothetical protein
VYIPAKAKLPRLDQLKIEWQGRQFLLPYLYREGNGGPIPASAHFFFTTTPSTHSKQLENSFTHIRSILCQHNQ